MAMRAILSGGGKKKLPHPRGSRMCPVIKSHIFARNTWICGPGFDAGTGVAPLRAGLKQQRLFGELPDYLVQGHAHRLGVVADGGGPGILNAGGVGKQVADRERVVGTLRWSASADGGGHAHVVEFRQVLFDRVAQGQLSLFGQLMIPMAVTGLVIDMIWKMESFPWMAGLYRPCRWHELNCSAPWETRVTAPATVCLSTKDCIRCGIWESTSRSSPWSRGPWFWCLTQRRRKRHTAAKRVVFAADQLRGFSPRSLCL